MEPHHFNSTVDTSRPFSSVKEAVAIFGERLLVGEIYSPSPKPLMSETWYSPIKREPSWRLTTQTQTQTQTQTPTRTSTPPSPMKSNKEEENGVLDTIRKLEAELEKTKVELKQLKERGSETEVALATLNAELHKNMSKLARAEAVAAGKAAVAAKTVRFEISEDEDKEKSEKEEIRTEKKKEYVRRMEDSGTLGHIMSLGENDHLFGGKKVRKHKPIIPLVPDFFFFKRKSSSTTNHHNPLYASHF